MIVKLNRNISTIMSENDSINKLCFFNYDIGDKYENVDNSIICKSNDIIDKRKRLIEESIKNKRRFDDSKIIKLDSWRGVLDIVNDNVHGGKILSILESENKLTTYQKIFKETLIMIRGWMNTNNQDVYCSSSIFNTYGKKNSKFIEDMIYEVFEKCDKTLYILRKQKTHKF